MVKYSLLQLTSALNVSPSVHWLDFIMFFSRNFISIFSMYYLTFFNLPRPATAATATATTTATA